ncbi:hypothetical protein PBY51_022194 [Eleginops maclovinus]|uniref:Uncharacterized protein n=1 Tax=Eleginops maclovinus TaxID=56733 RepID=A0AAN7XCJ4_ELEMC|nr:hypothetical protein PBY51_022194 [Eleginops maclovinus]
MGGGDCRGTSCQTRLLIGKLNKPAARPSANDGGYSLTTHLLVLMADKPAAQKHSAGPPREGITVRAERPPLGGTGHCSITIYGTTRLSL